MGSANLMGRSRLWPSSQDGNRSARQRSVSDFGGRLLAFHACQCPRELSLNPQISSFPLHNVFKERETSSLSRCRCDSGCHRSVSIYDLRPYQHRTVPPLLHNLSMGIDLSPTPWNLSRHAHNLAEKCVFLFLFFPFANPTRSWASNATMTLSASLHSR